MIQLHCLLLIAWMRRVFAATSLQLNRRGATVIQASADPLIVVAESAAATT
jgi:hypothetical protein